MKVKNGLALLLAMIIAVMPLSAIAEKGVFKLPAGLKEIDEEAFAGDNSLEEVILPDGVEKIADNAFDGPDQVSMTANEGTYGYEWAKENGYIQENEQEFSPVSDFRYEISNGECTITRYIGSATEVRIPKTIEGAHVTSIGELSFEDCSSLTNIIIPESVTSIGDEAFSGCSSLTNITIPGSVTSIGGAAFCSCIGLTDITIPSSVIRIGNDSFGSCDSLISINVDISNNYYSSIDGVLFDKAQSTLIRFPSKKEADHYIIPDAVTSISDYAFENCGNLISISILDSITSIGEYPFRGCSNLASINVNSGNNSFSSVDGVLFDKNQNTLICYPANKEDTNYSIPDTVTSIECRAFDSCSNLTSITIPDSFTSIGYGSFDNCRSLTNVIVPNSVNSIDYRAFCNCSGLISVILPNSVTRIEEEAFGNCSNLASISIPNSMTIIVYGAFDGCSNLTIYAETGSYAEAYAKNNNIPFVAETTYSPATDFEYEISNGECTITKYTGSDNEVRIPKSFEGANVTSIGSWTFRENSNLTNVVVPETVTSIGGDAFGNCSSLTSITVESGNAVYSDIDGVLFDKNQNTIIRCPEARSGDYSIPNTVTNIAFGAFINCSRITSINIPESVINIEDGAFSDCSSLTSITIPDSVVSIGVYAFSGCNSLKSVTISNSVTSIGYASFAGLNSLISITIPSSVINIGDHAFTNCKNLTIYGEAGSYAETYATENGIPFVVETTYSPASDFEYEISNGECKITKFIGSATEVRIPQTIEDANVTSIGGYAFSACSSLTSITIPDFVTSIGNYAFYNCSSLISIAISGSVTSIGKGTFWGCKNLTSITIPDSVTSIGSNAFYICSNLTNISIPRSVTSIGERTFWGCSSLTSIIIPDSVTSIGSYAFYNCSSLTSIAIPCSVTSIDERTFWGCSSLTSIIIPDSVTNIESCTFYECGSLTSVTIPDSITSIGDHAFHGCKGLTSITIPDSVTSIGSYAFYNCSSLTSIIIPDSVTSIGSSAFEGCSSLTSIIIPDSVTSIGDWAFSACSSLTSITIPDSVTSIGEHTFWGCSGLTSIVIPDSVTNIANAVFGLCISLTSIAIPDSVTSIRDEAFYGCSSLASITIPNSVTSIGGFTFWDCSSLTSITIPDSVISIASGAFGGCSSLTSITIPDSVTSIDEEAFAYCDSLTNITIPDSVTSIGDGAFSGCPRLTIFGTAGSYAETYANENSIPFVERTMSPATDFEYEILNGKCFIKRYIGSNTEVRVPKFIERAIVSSIGDSAFYGCSSLTSITIPSSVISIGNSAFEGCSSLTSITIPDSVTSIEWNVFSNCINLTSITIPDSITRIEGYSFKNCSSLTSITIPDSVTSIGYEAFCGCSSLTSITIPNSVTGIGGAAFKYCSSLTSITIPDSVTYIGSAHAFHGCSSLTSITIPDSVTSIGDWAFEGCSSLTSITIPESVTSIGYSAFYGCSSLTSIAIPCSVTSIDERTFWGCSSLTSLTIPDSVTSIGLGAFVHCSSLTIITIPDSVTSIRDWVFEYCNNLTSITIPESVTSIGYAAFDGCISLTSITMPDSVASISDIAFNDCSSLISITIPESVTNIGYGTFKGCSSLTSIAIPNSVASIGKSAFNGCSSLTSITIPDSVTSIGSYAFYNCSNLTSITIPNSVTSIGEDTFRGCSSLTIYGEAGSYAETYANENSIPFKVYMPTEIDPANPEVTVKQPIVMNAANGDRYFTRNIYDVSAQDGAITLNWNAENGNGKYHVTIIALDGEPDFDDNYQATGANTLINTDVDFETYTIDAARLVAGQYIKVAIGAYDNAVDGAMWTVFGLKVNAELPEPETYITISGKVQLESGEGLSGVKVAAYYDDTIPAGETMTGSDGSWSLDGVHQNTDYTIYFYHDNFIINTIEYTTGSVSETLENEIAHTETDAKLISFVTPLDGDMVMCEEPLKLKWTPVSGAKYYRYSARYIDIEENQEDAFIFRRYVSGDTTEVVIPAEQLRSCERMQLWVAAFGDSDEDQLCQEIIRVKTENVASNEPQEVKKKYVNYGALTEIAVCPHGKDVNLCCICMGKHEWEKISGDSAGDSYIIYKCGRCEETISGQASYDIFRVAMEKIPSNANVMDDSLVVNYIQSRINNYVSTQRMDLIINHLKRVKQSNALKLYLYSLPYYEFKKGTGTEKTQFSGLTNTMRVNESAYEDDDEFLSVWFHESGHAIDFNSVSGLKYRTHSDMINTSENRIFKLLQTDVGTWISIIIKQFESEGGEIIENEDDIVEALVGANRDNYRNVNNAIHIAIRLTDKVEEHSIKKNDDSYYCVDSQMIYDMYGGITNNKVQEWSVNRYKIGHGPGITDDEYWYKSNGESTYNQCSEGFAEFFSSMMIGNARIINNNRDMLPLTTDYMGGFMRDLAMIYANKVI